MEEPKRTGGRAKRPKQDEGTWDCSVCTYKNSQEAYKCEMCDVRKGTSTRKPRINPQIVAQQVATQFAAPLTPPGGSVLDQFDEDFTEPPLEARVTPAIPVEPLPAEPLPAEPLPAEPLGPPPPPKPVVKKEKSASSTVKREKPMSTISKNTRSTRLKNVDRNSARHMSVTVGTVTVVITDYQPKKRRTLNGQKTVLSDASDTSSTTSNDIHEDRNIAENHT